MGIRHLETYMKKRIQSGSFTVNMERAIAKYRRLNGRDALIVIDLMGFVNLFQLDLEILCGMRSEVYLQRLRTFLQRLVNCGAKLVFFSDGPVQSDKEDIWFARRDRDYQLHLAIIDELDQNTSVKDLISKGLEIKSSTIVSFLLKDVAKEFGEVHSSMKVECDLALAAYACSKNAFAVMADDTDFLIYPGTWRYWSLRSIKTYRFTTEEFNKEALRSYLGLSMAQLPLFATIAGNDIVKYDDVKNFHHRIGEKYKFVRIADYIRDFPLSLQNEDYESIARNVFRHMPSWEIFVEKLKASIEFYNINSIALQSSEEDPFLQKLLDNNYGHVYVVLQRMPFSITNLYNDFRDQNCKPYSHHALEMYTRQTGILLQHQRDKDNKLKVNVKLTHDQSFTQILVEPVYSSIPVPDLDALIFRKENDNLDTTRHALFKWALIESEELDVERLFQLPKQHICSVATLCFLVKKHKLSVVEADIFLISICEAAHSNNETIENTKAPEFLLKDAFLNVFLYLKLYNFITRILTVTGLKEFKSKAIFDGFMYHNLHQEWPTLDAESKAQKINDAQYLRLYT